MKLDGLTEPAVSVEIDTSLIGSFVWGISEWGGSDTWSDGNGEWTGVPASHVRSVSIRRGRSREDQAVQPGTLTAVLDNLSGDYAPDNESSPWRWGSESLMQRGIGVRVRAGFRPAADLEAERLLKTAVLYLDAQNPGSTPTASVKNLGTGRAALNATLGSTAGADSNDPQWLPYAGANYIYLPGGSNSVSVTAPTGTTQYAAYPDGGGAPTTGAATAGATFTFSTTGSWSHIDLLTAGSTVTASLTASSLTGSSTSLTDAYGKAWTITRATSGRKTTIVTANCWLLGTDDYMECPDLATLDYSATSSFSVSWAGREWATPVSAGALVAKRATGAGYALTQTGTTHGATFTISDGTNTATATSPASSSGALRVYTAVVNRTAQTLTVYCDGVAGTPVSITTVGDLSNAEALRIGRLSGASTSYSDAEDLGAAVHAKALTAAEVAKISTYYATRAATPATMTTMYRGYIETVDADLGFTPMATITASDGLAKIAQTTVPAITANYAGDTTATRIGRILDAIDWDASLRDLNGSRTMLDTTYGASALALADEAALCEYGVFYASKDGLLTSKTYEAGFSTTLRFQLSDDPTAGLMDYADLTTKPSTEYLVNDVTLTVGTATVTSTNDQSAGLRGKVARTYTTPLDSLVTAQALADIIVDRLSANTVRADSVEIVCAGLTTTEWGNVIAAELHERLTAARTTRDGRHRSYNCVIESINHDITPRGWTLRMNLSPGLGGSFFVWGTSLWGGDDRWYY